MNLNSWWHHVVRLHHRMAPSSGLRSRLGDQRAGEHRTGCPATGAYREGHPLVEAVEIHEKRTFRVAQAGTIEQALEGWLFDGVHPRTAECHGNMFVVTKRVRVRSSTEPTLDILLYHCIKRETDSHPTAWVEHGASLSSSLWQVCCRPEVQMAQLAMASSAAWPSKIWFMTSSPWLGIVLWLLVTSHLVACFWFAIGNLEDGASWVTQNGLEQRSAAYQYATSLHWAVAQLGVGQTELEPVSFWEKVFSIGVMFAALLSFSTLLSSMTSLLGNLSKQKREELLEFKARKTSENKAVGSRRREDLRRFLEDNEIDAGLRPFGPSIRASEDLLRIRTCRTASRDSCSIGRP